MEITDFDIKPDREAVLQSVGCGGEGEARENVSRCFDEIYEAAMAQIDPRAAVFFDAEKLYCVLTVGEGISEMSKDFFDNGEAVKGLLADAIADECLFKADTALNEKIRIMCAERGQGVLKRLEAPRDFSPREQRLILNKAKNSAVSLTDAFMLSPLKSMAYIFELTDDTAVFNAQHDCSRCYSKDCPRRAAPYTGEILSRYEYTPLPTDESAVCIDIGTTTIAMEYVKNGVIHTYKTTNPQRRFGADVLSRIEAANRGRGDELNSLVTFTLKNGIREVTRGSAPDKIIISGNTAMVHFLMNYPCDTLGKYPFKSEHLSTIETEFDGAPTVITGGISAFVGGDIVSGLYMTDFDLSDKVNLFIDLGTNGEMAIGGREGIIATSTAAGPAFEGGRILSDVKGSDIISITADMLDNGIIDDTGKLCDKCFENGFKYSDNITVTQQAIRELQMAKAAVRAGIECLMSAYGVSGADINAVFIAGGMGYGLLCEKAARIGLLPRELLSVARTVGNSALGGAVKYACESGRERIENIRKISREFPLANHKDFDALYLKHMNF